MGTKKANSDLATKHDLNQLGDALRSEMQELKSHMGVLHEDVMSKLELLVESRTPLTERLQNHEERIETIEEDLPTIKAALPKLH